MSNSRERQLASFYERLGTYIAKDKSSKAVIVCDKILKVETDAAKLSSVQRTKCVCLVHQGKVGAALEVAGSDPSLAYERAYCLYKLKRNDEALAALEGVEGSGERNLRAQLLYRLGDFDAAREIYAALVAEAKPTGELLANYCAACVLSGRGSDFIDAVADHAALMEDASQYELVYNYACALVATNDPSAALEKLDKALALGTEYLEADDLLTAQNIDAELAPIKVQKAVALLRSSGDEDEARQLLLGVAGNPQEQQPAGAVAANNLLALRGDHDLFDSYKLMRHATPAEALDKLPQPLAQTVRVNKALLLLKMQKGAECRELLAELAERYPESPQPALVEAALLLREKKQAKCVEMLRELVNTAEGAKTAAYLRALAQIQVQRGELDEAVATLESVPSLRLDPSVVSAVAGLMEEQGKMEAAEAYLKRVLEEAQGGAEGDALRLAMFLGDFHLRRGKLAPAAELFDRVVTGKLGPVEPAMRMEALSNYVIAAAATDLDACEARAASLPAPPGVDEVDVEALASAMRASTRHVNASSAMGGKVSGKSPIVRASPSGSVDMAAIQARVKATKAKKEAKKRAKRREAYLAKLEDPAAVKPDPERWVPKSMREAARRARKKRGAKLTGAQGVGAVSDKDAARLDARQADVSKQQQQQQSAASKKKGKKKGRR